VSHVDPDRLIVVDGPVDTHVVAAYERTRREALRRGLTAGGAVLAATSIPLLLKVRNAFAEAEGDKKILKAAIALEQTAAFAYTTASESPALHIATRRIAVHIGDQEQEHAAGLIAALEPLGGGAPEAPVNISDVAGLQDAADDQRRMLGFALELETMAVAAYYDAHRKLDDPELLQTSAQIMANEGQHLVILRQAAGREPVPNAFETGRTAG
jgi:rubrerythrin